jgi:hypothetical protein
MKTPTQFQTITAAVALSGAEGKGVSNYDFFCGFCRGVGGESFYGVDFPKGCLCWLRSSQEGGG